MPSLGHCRYIRWLLEGCDLAEKQMRPGRYACVLGVKRLNLLNP